MRKIQAAGNTSPPIQGPLLHGQKAAGFGWLLALLALTCLIQMFWRTWLGVDLLVHPGVVQRSFTLVRWRALDQFIGWTALMILMFADGNWRASRIGPMVLRWVLLLGVGGVIAGEIGAWRNVELSVAALLIAAAGILSFRQLLGLARQMGDRGGLTIEQLWRLISIQWILLWVAAEAFLRIKLREKGGVAADEAARSLLYALPAFGVLPNLMMAMGIRFLHARPAGEKTAAPKPRPRAWILAMVAVNAGAACLLISERWTPWLSVPGAVAMVFAVIMYSAGFGRGAWKGAARWTVMASLWLMVVGFLLMAGERVTTARQISVLREFGAAWRFLITPGSTILWLLGAGGAAMEAWVPGRLQAGGVALAAYVLTAAGVVMTALMLVLSTFGEREWLTGIGPGCVLMVLGLLAACSLALRGWRAGVGQWKNEKPTEPAAAAARLRG